VCQRSSNHKLKAIHNPKEVYEVLTDGVSKIVKSQIESNSQLITSTNYPDQAVCQRSSNHKLKAIHNCKRWIYCLPWGVSKIVKSQIESNSQHHRIQQSLQLWCVKDRQITNWKQFTTE